ncbi:winged helix-turn-helix domain-containing protein [Bradyrhizobium diazoefficiens]|nr:winged helix-turn-helix domain-containing protein [Bradyrhizobium diazoefficiens]
MRYLFDDCALDTDRRELRRGPDVVPTAPQVLDLLEYLIRSRDRVVSKDDLANAIWGGRIVSDAALTTRLNAVRRAIGDSGEQQRLIKTFPRKGFRFVGAVHNEDRRPGVAVVTDAGTAAISVHPEEAVGGWLHRFGGRLKHFGGVLASIAAIGAIAGGMVGYWNVWNTVRTEAVREAHKLQQHAPVGRGTVPRLSLVVLPFTNFDEDPQQPHLAGTITTDLTTGLARAPATFVIGRETVLTYTSKSVDPKQIGTDLGVRWAVHGAVKRIGDQVRVNVSLTDLQTGRDIWSDRFDGEHANLAALQDGIAARILCIAHLHLRQYEAATAQCSRSLNMSGAGLQDSIGLISALRPEQPRDGNGAAARRPS